MALNEVVNFSEKILIVEDVRSARLATRKLLESLGFNNLVEAEDGRDALGLLQTNQDVRLILSDWQMPNIDGLQLVRLLQDDPRFKNIPFIMTTAKGELDDMVLATVVGVWGYIVKPITMKTLTEEIEGVFRNPETVAEAAQGS